MSLPLAPSRLRWLLLRVVVAHQNRDCLAGPSQGRSTIGRGSHLWRCPFLSPSPQTVGHPRPLQEWEPATARASRYPPIHPINLGSSSARPFFYCSIWLGLVLGGCNIQNLGQSFAGCGQIFFGGLPFVKCRRNYLVLYQQQTNRIPVPPPIRRGTYIGG